MDPDADACNPLQGDIDLDSVPLLLALHSYTLPRLRNPPQHLLAHMDCIQAAICQAFRHGSSHEASSTRPAKTYHTMASLKPHSADVPAEGSETIALVDQAYGLSLYESVNQLLDRVSAIADCSTCSSELQQNADIGASRKEVIRRCQSRLVPLLLNITAELASSPLSMNFSMPSATRFDQGPLPPMQSSPAHEETSNKGQMQPQQQATSAVSPSQLISVAVDSQQEQPRQIALSREHNTAAEASQMAACLLHHLAALHFSPAAYLMVCSQDEDGKSTGLTALQLGTTDVMKACDASQGFSQSADGASSHQDTACGSSSVQMTPAGTGAANGVLQSSETSLAGTENVQREDGTGNDAANRANAHEAHAEAATATPSPDLAAEDSDSDQEMDEPGSRLGAALALLCTLACPPAQGKLQTPADCSVLLEAAGEGCRLLLDSAAKVQVVTFICLYQCRASTSVYSECTALPNHG